MHKIVPFKFQDPMYKKVITVITEDSGQIKMVQVGRIWKMQIKHDETNPNSNCVYEIRMIDRNNVILNPIDEIFSIEKISGIVKELTGACRSWGIYIPEKCKLSVFRVSSEMIHFVVLYQSQMEAAEDNFNINRIKYKSDLKFKTHMDLFIKGPFPENFDQISKTIQKIFCPVCGEELLVAGFSKLETLDEHVNNPNGEISLKHTLVCGNVSCPACIMDFGWDECEQGLYNLGANCRNEYIAFKGGATGAIGGFSRKHELEEIYEKAHTHNLKIGWIVFDAYMVWNPIKCEVGFHKISYGWRTRFGIYHFWRKIRSWFWYRRRGKYIFGTKIKKN